MKAFTPHVANGALGYTSNDSELTDSEGVRAYTHGICESGWDLVYKGVCHSALLTRISEGTD